MTSAPRAQDWTLTAEWIFPIDQAPLRRGTVTVRGQHIVTVAPAGQRQADVDLGAVAILPGLVNAHTHLDLSGVNSLEMPKDDFLVWLRAVMNHRLGRTPEQVQADIRAGLAESLRHGTTLVGDIASRGSSWPVLAAAPLRAVVFHELLGLTAARADIAWAEAVAWLDAHAATPTCRPGLSPHAPYSVRGSLFGQVANLARQRHLPVAIHLAETPLEMALLEHRRGPLVDFLRNLGVWDADGPVPSCQHLLDLFRQVSPVLVAHGNYLPAATPLGSNAIVYCPRTHAYFGHPPHPFRDFVDRGVIVALGTDSRASSPDLDLLAEARFLRRRYPEIPGSTLLGMATWNGAVALGWDDEVGSLTPGKAADLITIPLPNEEQEDPHQLVLQSDRAVSAVLHGGQWLE